MPPSQLKRLKASLREKGITGPPPSKKDQKKNRNGASQDQRAKRAAALESIREAFNPFEVKTLARPKKFEVTSNRPDDPKKSGLVGRPGVTKSLGEETRRKTLLPELHKRNKVGGIVDRRFGENDPTMAPEDKLLERFTRENLKKRKGASLFDLEDEEEEELTHMGRSLDFGTAAQLDDFEDEDISGSSEDETGKKKPRKRRRDPHEDGDEEPVEGDQQPERKKSKAEVMKEVIAKSKMHKYERQQAKEEDMELREDLDKELPDILSALRGRPVPPQPPVTSAAPNDFSMNPDRAALLNGNEKDKEYDTQLRQLALDKRAAPTERTKTEEEKAEEEAKRLKELEEKRLRRMRGEEESESEEEDTKQEASGLEEEEDEEEIPDDAAEFGFKLNALPKGDSKTKTMRPAGVEDEDDFLIDDDLVASGSDVDELEFSEEGSENESEEEQAVDDDDEFVADLLTKDEKTTGVFTLPATDKDETKLAFTYPCPRSHGELLDVLKDVAPTDIPTVVQRIRALYHPQLHADNKAKLSDFAVSLVDHVAYIATQKPSPPLSVVETLIRHIHSLSRTFPDAISESFREHLRKLYQGERPSPGDLAILTAIGTIFPTSDHFHQVVTPAITLIARWLGLNNPQSVSDIATGAYLCALAIKYQSFSRRYIPELVRFTLLALKHPSITPALLSAHLTNLTAMADLWHEKSAFVEIFSPAALTNLTSLRPGTPASKAALQRLQILLAQARLRRRPLELHHHRPLPIKTAVPKFEETFNPDKHYDPDRERAEAAKLRAEYKKERKGALRELRKDANFIARQQLKEKRERDAAYEAKYKRLVAEIQGEEGREANAYEREKRARKGRK